MRTERLTVLLRADGRVVVAPQAGRGGVRHAVPPVEVVPPEALEAALERGLSASVAWEGPGPTDERVLLAGARSWRSFYDVPAACWVERVDGVVHLTPAVPVRDGLDALAGWGIEVPARELAVGVRQYLDCPATRRDEPSGHLGWELEEVPAHDLALAWADEARAASGVALTPEGVDQLARTSPPDPARFARMYGCWLGERLRAARGGAWSVVPSHDLVLSKPVEPGRHWPIARFFPVSRVWLRTVRGEAPSLPQYYADALAEWPAG